MHVHLKRHGPFFTQNIWLIDSGMITTELSYLDALVLGFSTKKPHPPKVRSA